MFSVTLLWLVCTLLTPVTLVAQISIGTYTVDSTVRHLVLPWQAKITSTNWRSSSTLRTVYLSSGGRWRNDGANGAFQFTSNVVPPHSESRFDSFSETTYIVSNDSVYRVKNDIVSAVGKLPFIPQSLVHAWDNRLLFLQNNNLIECNTDNNPTELDTLLIDVQQMSCFDNVAYVETQSGVLRLDITTHSKQPFASIPGATLLTADDSSVFFVSDSSLYIARGEVVVDTIALSFRHSAYSAVTDGKRLLVLGKDSTAATASYSITLSSGTIAYSGTLRLKSPQLESPGSGSEVVAIGSTSGFVVYNIANDQYRVSMDYQHYEHNVTAIVNVSSNQLRVAGVATGPTLGISSEKVAVFIHFDLDRMQVSDVFYITLAPDEYYQPTTLSDSSVLCFTTSKRVFAFSDIVQEVVQSNDVIVAAAIHDDTVYYSTPRGLFQTNRSSEPPQQIYSTESSSFAVVSISVSEQGVIVSESMPGTPPTRKHSIVVKGSAKEIPVPTASQFVACIPLDTTLILTGRYFEGPSPRQRFKIGQLLQNAFQENETFEVNTGVDIESYYRDTITGCAFPWGIFIYDNQSKQSVLYSPTTSLAEPFLACSRPRGGRIWAVANDADSPRLYQLTLPTVTSVETDWSKNAPLKIVLDDNDIQVLNGSQNVSFSIDNWSYDGRVIARSVVNDWYATDQIPIGSFVTVKVQEQIVALLTKARDGQLYVHEYSSSRCSRIRAR
ncbi:MAG: hypothetical protein IPI29_14350 [Ignavibacteria bacterium]|nr:hypothetical protein [Ignavibacteria bacterium]